MNKIAEKLWGLLDDIDTASDMFKPSDEESFKQFYSYVITKSNKRHELMKTDGFNLFPVMEDKPKDNQ